MGCATAPSVPPPLTPCPQLPALSSLPPHVLEPSFIDRMQNFLHGKLSEPISYELPSKNVRLPTMRPEKN